MRAASRSSSLVLPSTSVNMNVTVPLGSWPMPPPYTVSHSEATTHATSSRLLAIYPEHGWRAVNRVTGLPAGRRLAFEGDLSALAGRLHDGQADFQRGHAPAAVMVHRSVLDHRLVQLLELRIARGCAA